MATAKIDNAAFNGAKAIIAGKAGYTIRVHGFGLVAAGAVTAKWQSGTTDLTGAMTMTTASSIVAPSAPMLPATRAAHFETADGDDLNLTTGAGIQVSGWIEYSYAKH